MTTMTPRAPVLLVEDDSQQSTLMAHWLEQSGCFEVSVAGDGALGWDLIGAKPWALIISDIQLPGLNGLSLLRRFRSADDETPFLLVSGHASLDSAHQAIRLRASDFLVKPLERDHFISVTKGLLGTFRRTVERRNASHARLRMQQSIRLLSQGQQLVHRLANQLTPMVAAADLIAAETARPIANLAAITRYCGHISQALDGTIDSLNRLRDLVSSADRLDESYDLNALTHGAWVLVAPVLASRHVPLQVHMPAQPTVARGHRDRMKRLLSGLLLAISEDSVRLRVRRVEVVVSAGVDGPCVRIRLQRDPAALADRDPLVDLIEVFDRTASELGTRLELRAQDDGSLDRDYLGLHEQIHLTHIRSMGRTDDK